MEYKWNETGGGLHSAKSRVLILVLMEYKWNEDEYITSSLSYNVLILVLMEYKWNQCSRAQGFEWFESLKVQKKGFYS